jgi:hypothetical protein
VLNAGLACVREELLAEARDLGDRIAKGEDPGPLAGLPFGVKAGGRRGSRRRTVGALRENFPKQTRHRWRG